MGEDAKEIFKFLYFLDLEFSHIVLKKSHLRIFGSMVVVVNNNINHNINHHNNNNINHQSN
jgi:hypothetical protein